MPAQRAAARDAMVADLTQTLRALKCAVRLLQRRESRALPRILLLSMRRALRHAEQVLRKLPSP